MSVEVEAEADRHFAKLDDVITGFFSFPPLDTNIPLRFRKHWPGPEATRLRHVLRDAVPSRDLDAPRHVSNLGSHRLMCDQ